MFFITQDDTSPALLKQMIGDDGLPIDLTGATATFSMASVAGVNIINKATASVFTGSVPGIGVVTQADGWLRYAWAPPDTAAAGDFLGQFKVTFADGAIESAPNGGAFEPIRIGRSL